MPPPPSNIKFDGSNLYTWVKRGTVRVKVLLKNTKVTSRPGLEPGPLDPRSSALTIRPPRRPCQTRVCPFKEVRHCSCILKKMAKLFKIVITYPFQSSPYSAILVPFCSRIAPLVFFFLSKPLFLSFSTP